MQIGAIVLLHPLHPDNPSWMELWGNQIGEIIEIRGDHKGYPYFIETEDGNQSWWSGEQCDFLARSEQELVIQILGEDYV